MQKRLTTRDTVLYTLLALMILLLVLLMYQIDRQWNKLNEMQIAVSEQAKDVQGVRSSISNLQGSFNGVVTSAAAMATVAATSSVSPSTPAATQNIVASEATKASTPQMKSEEKQGDVSSAFQRASDATKQSEYAQGDWMVASFANTVK